jgi:phosphoenolpyruvate-protein phosphotransferase (PTS system enzyme I)
MLHGKGASHGIAVGQVLVLEQAALVIDDHKIENVDLEIDRFRDSLQKSKSELLKIREEVFHKLGKDKAEIFDAHVLVLEDPELVGETEALIRTQKINASASFRQVSQQFISMFEAMDNEYMRERASDIRDISDRVLRTLAGVETVNLSLLSSEVIIVAHDLTPSETATMNRDQVLGILTNVGGKTSHTAIMARTLEVPAVLGLRNITEVVKSGDWVALDGETGDVIINPDEQTRKKYLAKHRAQLEVKEKLLALIGVTSETTDGHRVELAGNIGTPQDIKSLEKYDAEGVGLYRTEFLFVDRSEMPSEEEQYVSYKLVLEAMASKRVVIRTFDIGGDKAVPFIDIGKEENPFLGYRAIRYCLEHPALFRTQLRALMRASVHGKLNIMFPMISSLDELLKAKEHLGAVCDELKTEGIPFDHKVGVGTMIEIPSAALISDVLAQHCDFLSIGTNDLIQYTVAVDRLNERVQSLYDPFHPGVLRLIQMIINNGHEHGVWVGMCGEMAGSELHVPLLLGMGLDEFSMAPTSILRTRAQVKKWSLSEAKALAAEVAKLHTSAQVESLLVKMRRPFD